MRRWPMIVLLFFSAAALVRPGQTSDSLKKQLKITSKSKRTTIYSDAPTEDTERRDFGRTVQSNVCANDGCINELKLEMSRIRKTVQSQKEAIKYLENGWVTFGLYRVWFSLFSTNWHSANQYCLNKNARLASGAIKSFISRKQVYDYAKNQGHNYWIGANDLDKEGHYVWSDGGTLSRTSHLWQAGEPNDDGNQDCVRFWIKYSKLDDYLCYSELRFICEMPA